LAGSDDEDYGAQNRKPAAQKKKPVKTVGSFMKPVFCVCVGSLFAAFTSQSYYFLGNCTGERGR
jgi:hypothetical protein